MKDTPTTAVDLSHHLQRAILLQLRQAGALTYQQLKPDGVEGNAYNYHLRNLKQAKLIAAEDRVYHLTATGHIVADAFSFSSERLVLRPHSYTHLLVTAGEKVLLYHPTRQPLPSVHCLPSGKMHYGDTYETSIAREMSRRGLTDDYTAHALCAINVCYWKEGEVILQRPGHMWHVDYRGPLTESTTPSGSAAWWNTGELDTAPKLTADVAVALARLKGGSSEPIELNIEL